MENSLKVVLATARREAASLISQHEASTYLPPSRSPLADHDCMAHTHTQHKRFAENFCNRPRKVCHQSLNWILPYLRKYQQAWRYGTAGPPPLNWTLSETHLSITLSKIDNCIIITFLDLRLILVIESILPTDSNDSNTLATVTNVWIVLNAYIMRTTCSNSVLSNTIYCRTVRWIIYPMLANDVFKLLSWTRSNNWMIWCK